MAAKKQQPNPTTAKPIKGRSGLKNQVLNNDPTRDYVATKYQYYGDMFIHQLPLWRLWTGKMMLTSDPIINFSLNIRNAALGAADVVVTGRNPRVVEWVQKQWDFLWNNFREKLVSAKKYGFSAIQIVAKADRQGLVTIKGLKDFDPVDCRALELDGRLVGQSVKGAKVYFPQAMWLNFGAEYGNYYGMGVLRRQYPAWYEKWMDHGAKRLLQLRMIKDAYIGDIFWYPPNLLVELPDGTKMSWRDMMREIGENRLSGGALTLPRFLDNNGKELTGYDPPQDTGGGSQIFEWVETCDNNILRGADVPSEVVQAADTGSGFSGRSIPFLVVLSVCTEELVQIVRCVNEQVLRPLAWINFGGEPEYEITPMSLVESFGRDLTGSPMAGSTIGTPTGQGQPQQGPPVQIQQHSEATELNQDHLTSFQNGLKQKLGLKSLWLWHDPGKKNIKLDSIQVHKHQQGQGIGSQAMREITSLADKHGHSISLTTGVRDPSMGTTSANRLKRFYSRFGFKKNKDLSLSANMYRAPNSQHSESDIHDWLSRHRSMPDENGLHSFYHGSPNRLSQLAAGSKLVQDAESAAHFAARDRGLSHSKIYIHTVKVKPEDIYGGQWAALHKDTQVHSVTKYKGEGKHPKYQVSQHSEEQFSEPDYQPVHHAIAKRFGIPVRTVHEVLHTPLEQLRKREDESYAPSNKTELDAEHPHHKLPLGSAHVDSVIGRLEPERAYVGYLVHHDPKKLTPTEPEDGIKRSHTYHKYLEWAKAGHKPPPINVNEGYKGGLLTSNRRRTLAAQEAGTPHLLAWHSPINKETGNPLKYGDIHKAAKEHAEQHSEKPSYSSTQFNIPEPAAWKIIELAKLIPDEDLHIDEDGSKGRETLPHVTVKYGLHTDNPQDVREVVAGASPIAVTLGEVTTFSCERYDVVKIDVQSKSLHALNKLVSDSLAHTDTYPDYKPHITLAYVKSGEGEKWAKRLSDKLIGKAIAFDTLVFSDKERNHTEIRLGGESQFSEPNLHAMLKFHGYDPEGHDLGGGTTFHQHKDGHSITLSGGNWRHHKYGKFSNDAYARKHENVSGKGLGSLADYLKKFHTGQYAETETSPCEPFCEPVEQYGERPKVLYRGVMNSGKGAGTYSLGKGLYSTTDKGVLAGLKFDKIVTLHPDHAYPTRPLRLPSASHFSDWLLSKSGHKNIRDFNKEHPDPGVFVRKHGYDGVHAGNEVVRYSDDEQYGEVLSPEQATELVSKIRTGDARSKHKGISHGSYPQEKEAHTHIRLPLSSFSPHYVQYLRESTDPERVATYKKQKIDTPIHAVKNRKGNWVLHDGGHRTVAAIERGDTHINALVPVSHVDQHSEQYGELEFYHGSPSGELKGSHYGLHIGSKLAAEQALHSRIGVPVHGTWDGTRKYGETLLAGKKTLTAKGIDHTGYNADAPEHDHYPTIGKAKFSDGNPVEHHHKPTIVRVSLKGPMSNTPHTPHEDFKANGYMKAALKRGNAKRGYFYRNVGEDAGSISAVVPNASHIEVHQHSEQYAEREYPLADREKDGWYAHHNYEQTGAKLVHMSPAAYLKKVRPLAIDEASRDNIDSLKRHIEGGGKLDPLSIYHDGKEDGRHRAHAAKELGIKQVPVLIHTAQHAEQYGEHIIGYHAPTKGEFDKPDTSMGSDADIMGKGFYFGTKEYASKYGTPKPYKIRGNFASGYAWVAALAKHSKKPIEHQRAAARADLQKKGYHGVHNGTVGVVWHDHLITPHEENQHAEQFSETEDIKRLREFIQKGMAARIQEASTRILRLKQTFLDKPNLFGEIEREILALRPLLQDSFSAVNYVATLDGMAEIIGITPPVSTKEQPTATDVPSLTTALFNGVKPEHLPESIDVFPTLRSAVATLEASPAATGINYKETAELVRQGSFAVTAELTDHAVADLRDMLAESMRLGDSRDEFIDKVYENLSESGKLSTPHLENIFRTNVLSAISNGKAQAMAQPIVADAFPYVVYYATRDGRVREEHLELETLGLNGTGYYRFDDPVFKTFRPPWSWQCRCRWYPQTVAQAAAKGVKEAIEWMDRAKEAAQEKGGSFYEYLNTTAPTNPEFVPMPDFSPPPEFHRTPN